MRCRMCGCTETQPCEPPCSWAPGRGNLCTACLAVAAVVSDWRVRIAHRANFAALKREVLNADLPEILEIKLNGR